MVIAFFCLALSGPMAAILGLTLFAAEPVLLSRLMLFAAGGILYLGFHDIAQAVRLDRARLPGFGTVMGFTPGLVGHMATVG